MCICSGIAVEVCEGDVGSMRVCICSGIRGIVGAVCAGDARSVSRCICSDIAIAGSVGDAVRVISARAVIHNSAASQVY